METETRFERQSERRVKRALVQLRKKRSGRNSKVRVIQPPTFSINPPPANPQIADVISDWPTRETADKARHLTTCAVCRNGLSPDRSQKLYAVKNVRTRQFVHVLVNGKSLEDTLGWPKGEILYSILKDDGAPKGPPMSEEVKAKLRENGEKKKAENELMRLVRANTPARLAEGEQQESEEKAMSKKKSKKTKSIKTPKKAIKARPSRGADAFLPAKFTRKHGGVDHIFERDGAGWRLDGDGPMPLRHAMAKLMGKDSARATSFIRYFKADKIVSA